MTHYNGNSPKIPPVKMQQQQLQNTAAEVQGLRDAEAGKHPTETSVQAERSEAREGGETVFAKRAEERARKRHEQE